MCVSFIHSVPWSCLFYWLFHFISQEYDWKNYQSNRLSPSELQMLASMERQRNEELRDAGISHGLSASQIDNCNVSISASSDDTETWSSCFPPVSLNLQYFLYTVSINSETRGSWILKLLWVALKFKVSIPKGFYSLSSKTHSQNTWTSSRFCSTAMDKEQIYCMCSILESWIIK